MKNRAKCKLCNAIIESFHRYDLVGCKCGEISISGGNEAFECSALNWDNFLRVDDQGNEIIVKVVETKLPPTSQPNEKPSKTDLIKIFDEVIKNIERLPEQAMSLPISHYDHLSLLLLLRELFRSS